jgi:hypothetical protein
MALKFGLGGLKNFPSPAFEPQTTQIAVSHYAIREILATFEHELDL